MSETNDNTIRFSTATVYARSIKLSNKLYNVWNVHRAMGAKLDTGVLVIEKQWFKK
jgi:hypothetical protein